MSKKIYIVLDTNVLVSGMLKKQSIPSDIVALATQGNIIPILHKKIIAEYNEVLRRPKFPFDEFLIKEIIARLEQQMIEVSPLFYPFPLADEKDRIFLETALSARKQFKDVFLVTGNKKHFPTEPFIVNANEFLQITQKQI